ncbi:PrpF protein [Roridomyces roridus]|uniref:PrpF protein n=1 Tax=Roridomyces roridus TaxID=1738132 RepID=A0AAD7FGP6_9AGAR|nr:PrpF protein [Roridomyces roridus]
MALRRLASTLPATFIRGGTSKGIFIQRQHLPSDPAEWPRIFLGIMGSPDREYGRQLNGMGGGISSLSKICVVGPASAEHQAQGIPVEYTFVQVGVRDSTIDYSGNCGNLSSMIGVFARDENLCAPPPPGSTHMSVRTWNVNTQKVIQTTFPVSGDGVADLELPETSIAGVPGKASTIMLMFENPGGARTGKLLPSGSPVDSFEISISPTETRTLHFSLVDVTNPTVLVDSAELSQFLAVGEYVKGSSSDAAEQVGRVLELIRQKGAEKMGLDPSAQAQPKIALLSAPSEEGVDIVVHALSMGVLHKAIPMTLGCCAGCAANIPGTIAWDIVQKRGRASDMVRIKHPGGFVDVNADFNQDGSVKVARVARSGRRLMRGEVYW